MSVNMHMYIYQFVCQSMKERCAFIKLQCILVIFTICDMLCNIMLYRTNLH